MTTAEGIRLPLPITGHRTGAPSAAETDISTLVHAYSPILFRVAHSILRSRSEAEDVVQDVFLRVVERSASLATIQDPRVWLIRIAWNLALDRRRAIRPNQMDDAFADALTAASLPADAALAEQHTLRLVLTEIERLPAKERHVLLLSAIEELSTAEIAVILNRSESAVRSLLHRARTRLLDRIQPRPAKGVL